MELDKIKKTMIGGRTWRKETHTIRLLLLQGEEASERQLEGRDKAG